MKIKFPNGFTSWQETYYEMVAHIEWDLLRKTKKQTEVRRIQEGQGHSGLYTLARIWTDQFERLYKGHEWDGDFYDKIDEFFKLHNA